MALYPESVYIVSVDCSVTELHYHADTFVPANYYARSASEGGGLDVNNFEAL